MFTSRKLLTDPTSNRFKENLISCLVTSTCFIKKILFMSRTSGKHKEIVRNQAARAWHQGWWSMLQVGASVYYFNFYFSSFYFYFNVYYSPFWGDQSWVSIFTASLRLWIMHDLVMSDPRDLSGVLGGIGSFGNYNNFLGLSELFIHCSLLCCKHKLRAGTTAAIFSL